MLHINSLYYVPNIIEIGQHLRKLQSYKKVGVFIETHCTSAATCLSVYDKLANYDRGCTLSQHTNPQNLWCSHGTSTTYHATRHAPHRSCHVTQVRRCGTLRHWSRHLLDDAAAVQRYRQRRRCRRMWRQTCVYHFITTINGI